MRYCIFGLFKVPSMVVIILGEEVCRKKGKMGIR
jgi:hypothetical protein